jgi:hypothetical protein
MTGRSVVAGILLVFAVSRPAAAQNHEGLVFRPFVMASQQWFSAQDTFDAVFGSSSQTFFGGGVSITQNDQWYVDLAASRFKKTGQQAFFSNGVSYPLGIAMTSTITPFEVTAGYRFHHTSHKLPPLNRAPVGPSPFVPYLGAGIGSYRYEQTSDFATTDENVDTRHAGVVLEGGVEIRLHRFVGLALDAHYTYVPGILGEGGISKEAGESDLGGIAARFRFVIGR